MPPHARVNARIEQTDPRTDQWAPENLGFLHIATITGPHGVKGEVKAKAVGDFEKLRLGPGVHKTDRYLLLPGRKYPRPCKVLGGRRASQAGTWILKVDGITAREQVVKLRGSRIFVKEYDRPRLARNEYMVGDLVGSRVSLIVKPTDGEPWFEAIRGHVQYHGSFPIAIVDGVITREDLCQASGGGSASAAVASDLLEIALLDPEVFETSDGTVTDVPKEATRVLVPFVSEIVPFVDLERAVILIDPPEGLLSIAVVNRKEKPRPPRGLLCPAKD